VPPPLLLLLLLPAFGVAAATTAASAAANEAELGAATFDEDDNTGGGPGSGEDAMTWAVDDTDKVVAAGATEERAIVSVLASSNGFPKLDTLGVFLSFPGGITEDCAEETAAEAATFNGLPKFDTV